MNKRFSFRRLAKANIQSKPLRSFFLLIMVFIFSVAVFAGSLFIGSLSQGIEQISNRMGADVMVVPSGYKSDIEDVLLKGEPSTFYLPADSLEILKDQPGIKAMTPQFYIATLAASCCSYPLQLIGIDPETDFLVKPWLRESNAVDIKDGEALIGNNIIGNPGDDIKFFGEELKIAGRLSKTGTGFDGTIFINLKTAHRLAVASERKGVKQAVDNSQVSVIMIKVKPDLDPIKVAASISRANSGKGIFAMASKSFVNDLAGKLDLMANFIGISLFILWLMAIIILAMSFTTMINERKRELSALRILGATRRQLRLMVLLEAGELSFMGSFGGTLVGIVMTLIAFPLLANQLSIPIPTPGLTKYLFYAIATLVIGILIGPIASLPAAWRVSKKDAYTSMRETD